MTIDARFVSERGTFHLDVDFELPDQGISAVFGPSGCGKTSLLRAIAGLDRSTGHLRIGEEIWQDEKQFLPTHERALGYVFQEPSLFNHLTVDKNLTYGQSRIPAASRKVSFDDVVELLGLGSLLGRSPATLSGGEQQRVAIARALMTSPRLLLMDEPLASLDYERKLEILPYIDALHRDLEMPVLYVSHDRDEVARLADHLLLMRAGQIVAAGAIGDMLTRVDLPLVQGSDAEAIIEASVSGHDDEFQLTFLDSAAGSFTVTGRGVDVGADVRLRILAKDVSLTLAHQSDTSILNIFPATIDDMIPEGEAQMTVRLLVGEVPILARITRKSADNLGLSPGMKLFAQMKSIALLA